MDDEAKRKRLNDALNTIAEVVDESKARAKR